MNEKELLESIEALRREWRQVREKKLLHKAELLSNGHDISAVRRDRLYRDLRKRQHSYSVRIIHLERTLNRMMAREREH